MTIAEGDLRKRPPEYVGFMHNRQVYYNRGLGSAFGLEASRKGDSSTGGDEYKGLNQVTQMLFIGAAYFASNSGLFKEKIESDPDLQEGVNVLLYTQRVRVRYFRDIQDVVEKWHLPSDDDFETGTPLVSGATNKDRYGDDILVAVPPELVRDYLIGERFDDTIWRTLEAVRQIGQISRGQDTNAPEQPAS